MRPIEYSVSSGKVTEVYLTPNHIDFIKSGKKAWLKVKGQWLVINPRAESKKNKSANENRKT